MAIYARPVANGEDITAGKLYPVIGLDDGTGFKIADDVGFVIYSCWEKSCHIGGNKWERVEDGDNLAAQIAALPVIKQIELMIEIANGKDFGNLTNVISQDLDEALDAAYRDATDQAAAENDALHGPEVSQMTDMWVSPCGMRVGG